MLTHIDRGGRCSCTFFVRCGACGLREGETNEDRFFMGMLTNSLYTCRTSITRNPNNFSAMWSLSKVLVLLSVCETFAMRSPRFADPRSPVSDERYIGLSFEEDRFWVAEFKMSFTSSPTISPRPTMAPTNIPTMIPTRSPTDGITLEPSVAPTLTPTITPTNFPTTTPTTTSTPTISPRPTPQTQPPTQAPTTAAPTAAPVTDSPTATPTAVPTATPTISFNPTPSNQSRCGLTESERRQEIQTIIESVSDPTEVALVGSSRNLAFEWLVEEDELFLCPDSSNLVQRFVIALFYFATGGDNWSQCSQTDLACVGTPLLSGVNECSWYGIFCDGSSNTIEIIYGTCVLHHFQFVSIFQDFSPSYFVYPRHYR